MADNTFTQNQFDNLTKSDREWNSFTRDTDGAVRQKTTAAITGDVNVDSTSLNASGTMVGKSSTTATDADFTTAYGSATEIVIGTYDGTNYVKADDIEFIRQIASDGSVTNTYSRDDAAITVASMTATVTGASFAVGDTFVIGTNIPSNLATDDSSMKANPKFTPVGGEYRATSTTYTDGDAAVLQMDSKGNLKVAGGSSSVTAEFTSPSDFTATYTSSTTITLSGLPFTISDSSQIVYIRYIPSGGSGAAVLVNGSDGVTITVSSNVITVNGAGTPFASGDVYEVGINAQTKAYDASTNTQQNSVLNPVYDHYTDVETLDSATASVSSTWVDIGSEISMQSYNNGLAWITVTTESGSSTDMRFRMLAKHTSGGSEEYNFPIRTVGASDVKVEDEYLELNDDVNQNIILGWDTDNIIPYLQLQASAGTVSNTASHYGPVYMTKGYK